MKVLNNKTKRALDSLEINHYDHHDHHDHYDHYDHHDHHDHHYLFQRDSTPAVAV